MTRATDGVRLVVLERIGNGLVTGKVAYGVFAEGRGADLDSSYPDIEIPLADFRALGSPERIRITIEPGDRQEQEENRG